MPPTALPTRRSTRSRRVRFIEDADWYEHPRWYDILHAQGTAGEVRGLETIARNWCGWDGHRPLTLFEPACGTARHLRLAAARGHRVYGLDRAEPMLAFAREAMARRQLTGTLLNADMVAFDAGTLGLHRAKSIDLAFCPINSIRHLASDGDVIGHLRSTLSLLSPHGVYAVGIGLTQYDTEQPSEDVWTGARGRCRITQVVQYIPGEQRSRDERRERVISHLTIMTPNVETHMDHSYHLRRYDASQWRSILRRAGAHAVALVDEAGHVLDGSIDLFEVGYAIFLLRAVEGSPRERRI